MTAAARPHRQRKGDRITYSGASGAEIQCDFAIAPMDRLALDMDRKWGIDRLPELVTPALAAKYGAAIAHLNASIAAADPTATAAAAENCVKGLRAMDAEAARLGHQPITPVVWEHERDDGTRFGVIRETGDWPAAQAAFPGLTLYTLREVANAMAAYSQSVAKVKDAFPGAEIVAIRTRSIIEEYLDDEIPDF